MPSSHLSDLSKSLVCDRTLADRWNACPPQVTSFLSIPAPAAPSSGSKIKYESPACGFGWQYQVVESYRSQPSTSDTQKIELVRHVDVSFKQPGLFSSLSLSNAAFQVKVTYPKTSRAAQEKEFAHVSLKIGCELGTYEAPMHYNGCIAIAITLTFNKSDGLSLPNSPSVNLQNALHQSLDNPSFIDTKFYLYSAKKGGLPARPKSAFAKSQLLVNSSPYIHDCESTISRC
jgi:hypothetical protein